MSPLRGPSLVILWTLHADLLGAEDHGMDPTQLEDLSNRETAGIAQRQVGRWQHSSLVCTWKWTKWTKLSVMMARPPWPPPLHPFMLRYGSHPSVHCRLRDFCPPQSPFIVVGRGRYVFCKSFTSQTTAPVALLKWIYYLVIYWLLVSVFWTTGAGIFYLRKVLVRLILWQCPQGVLQCHPYRSRSQGKWNILH